MSQFKTQAQIFQALLEGKALVYKNRIEIKLVDGMIQSKDLTNILSLNYFYDLDYPKDWSIKKEPMVIWVNVYPANGLSAHPARNLAIERCQRDGRTVKFIEVEE